jgi:hypothetical protein
MMLYSVRDFGFSCAKAVGAQVLLVQKVPSHLSLLAPAAVITVAIMSRLSAAEEATVATRRGTRTVVIETPQVEVGAAVQGECADLPSIYGNLG